MWNQREHFRCCSGQWTDNTSFPYSSKMVGRERDKESLKDSRTIKQQQVSMMVCGRPLATVEEKVKTKRCNVVAYSIHLFDSISTTVAPARSHRCVGHRPSLIFIFIAIAHLYRVPSHPVHLAQSCNNLGYHPPIVLTFFICFGTIPAPFSPFPALLLRCCPPAGPLSHAHSLIVPLSQHYCEPRSWATINIGGDSDRATIEMGSVLNPNPQFCVRQSLALLMIVTFDNKHRSLSFK